MTDANGALAQTYRPDEFGSLTTSREMGVQPLQFTGKQRDTTRLIWMGALYYDPTIRRFLSRGVLFGLPPSPLTLNRYSYVQNNPLLLADPNGFSANRVTQDPCSDPTSLLRWFCGDNVVRIYPFGTERMTPFDRDIIDALERILGGHGESYASGGGHNAGDQRTVKVMVKDLIPPHSEETSGSRPNLEKLSDAELLEAASNASRQDPITINSRTGRLVDGNGRAYELRRRAADPNSSITWETEVQVELYTPR